MCFVWIKKKPTPEVIGVVFYLQNSAADEFVLVCEKRRAVVVLSAGVCRHELVRFFEAGAEVSGDEIDLPLRKL